MINQNTKDTINKIFKVFALALRVSETEIATFKTTDGQVYFIDREEFNNILKKEIKKTNEFEAIIKPKRKRLKDDRKQVCAIVLGISAKDILWLKQHKNNFVFKTNDGEMHRVSRDEFKKAKDIYLKEVA